MEITLPTLILSYLLMYLSGFGAGLLTCCHWKERFMSSEPRDGVTVQGAPVEPTTASTTAPAQRVAPLPAHMEIKLSQ